MKTCSRCHSEKPDTDFHRAPNTPDKLNTVCKECKRIYNKSRYDKMTTDQRVSYNARARDQYHGLRPKRNSKQRDRYSMSKKTIHGAKSSRGCLRCGESDPYALDFHHVAEKEHNIGNGSQLPKSVTRAEIKKCIVLCANCHRKLHSDSWQLSDLYSRMESEYPEAYELLNQPVG